MLADAGFKLSDPKCYLVPKRVLTATVSVFYQELVTHRSPLDAWIKCGFLLWKILHLSHSSPLQGEAQPLARTRLDRTRAKPALDGHVPP